MAKKAPLSSTYARVPPPKTADSIHADIEVRLDALRAQLNELAPSLMPPTTPTEPFMKPPQPPRSKGKPTLLYMPSFETQQIRSARKQRAVELRAAVERKQLRSAPAGGKRTSGPRVRPPPPGSRPFGYRILSRTESTPAYTIARKIVLSARVDPLIPDDDGPGPGAHDTCKY